MCDILTHPRFARAPVLQPHPRRRKGTINFRRARADRRRKMEAYFAAGPDFPMSRNRDWVDVKIHGDIKVLRLYKALQSEGLMFTDGRIFEWPLDPEDRPPAA